MGNSQPQQQQQRPAPTPTSKQQQQQQPRPQQPSQQQLQQQKVQEQQRQQAEKEREQRLAAAAEKEREQKAADSKASEQRRETKETKQSGGGGEQKQAPTDTKESIMVHPHMSTADFDLLKVVGKGSFGKVMQVRKKDTGQIYAMKVLKKQQLVARKQVAHTKTERKVLSEIDHPFIVSLRFAFQTDTKLYMILDYFTGGELFFHLKSNGRFSEERAMFYAAQITSALECLHAKNIIYRDLKPENVLLDQDGHIKLTDFGLSKDSVASGQITHTFCGTPEYLAPEVIHGAGYGKAVDWWSLGTLLYEMLTGLPPFYNPNLHMMYEKIIRAKLHFPAYLSANARSILQALLERKPKDRLGSGETDAEEVKAHPFFSSIDWGKLVRKEIPPPFKPTTTEGATDTTNVDDEFKRETPKDTPVLASTLRSKVNFPDFTYAGPESGLGDGEELRDDD